MHLHPRGCGGRRMQRPGSGYGEARGQGRTFVARARGLIRKFQEATAALKAAQNRVIAFSAVNNPAGLAWGSSGGPLEVVDVSNV
jgi:hypothetical protein